MSYDGYENGSLRSGMAIWRLIHNMEDNNMTLCDLIELLKRAIDVKEIDKYRDEIMTLIPKTKVMVDYNQQNYAHQYDL